jgi:hypothetical protein
MNTSLSKTDALLESHPFSYDVLQRTKLFKESLLEELNHHYQNNKYYQHFCERKGFNPATFSGDITDIPAVAVSVFKELGSLLRSVEAEDIKISLQSSATSGVPSTVVLDKITSRRQTKAMIKVVQEFIGKERKHFIICDVKPKPENLKLMGARFAAIGGYLNFANSVEYILDVSSTNEFMFDAEKLAKHIASLDPNEPVVVFGFTYILFAQIVKLYSGSTFNFSLPKGSKLIHIGGWKKLENEKITKEVFNEQTEKIFGLEKGNVIDIYGFTEQMGLNYPDCKCGYKHTSSYSEVIVRDPSTRAVLPSGEVGVLEFVSPIPHSYPGNVVLTDDMGLKNDDPCEFGLQGTRFKILGRLQKAEIRGCGDILGSKMITANIENLKSSNSYIRIIHHNHEIEHEVKDNRLLEQIINSLKREQIWLRNQPIDALIGLVGIAASKWAAAEGELESLKDNGLGFLANWCSAEHLNRISTIGLRGNRFHVEQYMPLQGSKKEFIKANQRGLVCHWLAGNVQVLGMFALVQAILTKNVNLLKISSRDDGVFMKLLSAFKDVEFVTRGGYRIAGNDLLKTISIVYFEHTNRDAGIIMSKNANVRIAWGGREAVETVASYPKNYDTEDIIFGPKISFSVIANDVLIDERAAKKLARKVAVDSSIFDQTGCASPHNLFIEEGGVISPLQFTEYLSAAMAKVASQIPKGETSVEQISSIHSIRGLYDFKGRVWASSDSTWTVLFDEENFLSPPVYSRVITVHSVKHINDALSFVSDDIQTIGIAANGAKGLCFAECAADAGVMRCPDLGKMLNFESPWDGIILMDRLVRWSTFGGPLV